MKKLTNTAFGGLLVAGMFALVAVFTPMAPVALAQCDPSQGVTGGVNCAKV